MEFQVIFEKGGALTTAVVILDDVFNRFPGHRKPEKSLDEAKGFILKRIAAVLDEIKPNELPVSMAFKITGAQNSDPEGG